MLAAFLIVFFYFYLLVNRDLTANISAIVFAEFSFVELPSKFIPGPWSMCVCVCLNIIISEYWSQQITLYWYHLMTITDG